MQTYKEAEKSYCQFGSEYIDHYVGKCKAQSSAWNDTQLTTIVETFVNFIDSYAETFMKAGFPGDPVWVFEQLEARQSTFAPEQFQQGRPKQQLRQELSHGSNVLVVH